MYMLGHSFIRSDRGNIAAPMRNVLELHYKASVFAAIGRGTCTGDCSIEPSCWMIMKSLRHIHNDRCILGAHVAFEVTIGRTPGSRDIAVTVDGLVLFAISDCLIVFFAGSKHFCVKAPPPIFPQGCLGDTHDGTNISIETS